jgi:hypothetical protein
MGHEATDEDPKETGEAEFTEVVSELVTMVI